MNKTFIIDGGAGRVINSIPALEKYVIDNPQHNIKILVHGWDSLFWSNPLLQPYVFNINAKGVFDNCIKNADTILHPEPYHLPDFINQKINLSQSFNILINNCPESLVPRLKLTRSELVNASKLLQECTALQKKAKTIVLQPFGSSARKEIINGESYVIDETSRSMDLSLYFKIISHFSKEYNLLVFSDNNLYLQEDLYTSKINGDIRLISSIMCLSDYFIGCDSVGQHIARCFDKPGTVIFGSTYPENVSYPDWFQILDLHKNKRIYSPIRISEFESHLADRNNSGCMKYSDEEIKSIIESIEIHLRKNLITI